MNVNIAEPSCPKTLYMPPACMALALSFREMTPARMHGKTFFISGGSTPTWSPPQATLYKSTENCL